jgi:glycosyltransferase involved in cell wall biosynthesis
MNILEVHHGWDAEEPGGIVAMIRDLIDGLSQRGHRVTLLANDWAAPTPQTATDRDGRPYWRLSLAQPPASPLRVKAWAGWLRRFPQAVIGLRRFCQAQRIDIAHVHYASPLYLVFAAARLVGGPPYVVTTHRGDVMGYPALTVLQRYFFRRVLAGAAAVNGVSRHLAALTQSLMPEGQPVRTVHNGFSPSPAALLNAAEIEARSGLSLPAAFAIMVGNCRPYKGFDVAVEAWAKLAQEGHCLPLVVVGGGPDLEALGTRIRHLGLERWVRLVGPQPRHLTVSLSALAAMQIIPSRNEGQGIVVLEAGSVGTPVVCSDIPPFLEMVTAGESAAVFPSEDAEALAEAVVALRHDPGLGSRRAQALSARVRKDFSVAAMIDGYEALFAAALAAPGTQGRGG